MPEVKWNEAIITQDSIKLSDIIMERMGWKNGDKVRILLDDDQLIIWNKSLVIIETNNEGDEYF